MQCSEAAAVDGGAIPARWKFPSNDSAAAWLRDCSVVAARGEEGARELRPAALAEITIAACDLDKTLYPPKDDLEYFREQLRRNVQAMRMFESLGGFAFPVTGNNPLLAKPKFTDPANCAEELWPVMKRPGIFVNGSLVRGAEGEVLERWPLGGLRGESKDQSSDFMSALLDFTDHYKAHALPGQEDHESKRCKTSADGASKAGSEPALLEDVGLFFLSSTDLIGYAGAFEHVEHYARVQNIWNPDDPAGSIWKRDASRLSRDEIVKLRGDILQAVFVFRTPAPGQYKTEIKPKQDEVCQAMESWGLIGEGSGFRYPEDEQGRRAEGLPAKIPEGVGCGVALKGPMEQPVPEIDLTVGGVDKGQALRRFFQHEKVRAYLSMEGGLAVDPETHVAVFGDTRNDEPMFGAIGGKRAGLRVVMPHSKDETLRVLSNVEAEVSDVLYMLGAARQSSQWKEGRL